MVEPLEIPADAYRMLDYDLQAAIADYQAALAAHGPTVGMPAPAATSLVEGIVKDHDGLFVIVPPPAAPPEMQALPSDPLFYRSPAEQAQIFAAVAKEAAIAEYQAGAPARQAAIEAEVAAINAAEAAAATGGS